MLLIGFMVLFPLIAAISLALIKTDKARTVIVPVSAAVIALSSVVFAVTYIGTPSYLAFSSEIVSYIFLGMSCVIAVIILVFAIRYNRPLTTILCMLQLTLSFVLEIGFTKHAEVQNAIYIDTLSVIMVLIIGIVGSGICVYALGYMKDFQAHEPSDATDRRPLFFALMFIFLSAMFVIVMANNMSWLFAGWEITTFCSFMLIGYTRTPEAMRNAFRQINMNLVGGIAFVIALYFCSITLQTLDFQQFIHIACLQPAYVSFPLVGLAIAALTKAAQMPFHTWLLGAMVAPTPTSALLHSSTMVKAGVFLLIRLAPAFAVCTVPGYMVMLVGSFTFLICSLMAITQSNAKRVLAYSTIANLGLIAACAGVGTPEAVWAGIFLIIFHAIAKSLLFLCVGTAEHHIGSRDIEAMDLLFERMPKLARFMLLGIMCMFIAPFGMLIAKWGALVSFASTGNIVLILILGFGSAATFMFWAKWMGKLSAIAGEQENVETSVNKSEWVALSLMAILGVLCCVCLPVISSMVVAPYISSIFAVPQEAISEGNLWITAILTALLLVIYTIGAGKSKAKKVPVYLAGVSIDNQARSYSNSFSQEEIASQRNMYLDDLFGEDKLNKPSTIFGIVIMALGYRASFAGFIAALPYLTIVF